MRMLPIQPATALLSEFSFFTEKSEQKTVDFQDDDFWMNTVYGRDSRPTGNELSNAANYPYTQMALKNEWKREIFSSFCFHNWESRSTWGNRKLTQPQRHPMISFHPLTLKPHWRRRPFVLILAIGHAHAESNRFTHSSRRMIIIIGKTEKGMNFPARPFPEPPVPHSFVTSQLASHEVKSFV